jgi:hypothetical protein
MGRHRQAWRVVDEKKSADHALAVAVWFDGKN